MLYVMYIRRECILFIFFLIKMYMLARVLIYDLFVLTLLQGVEECL